MRTYISWDPRSSDAAAASASTVYHHHLVFNRELLNLFSTLLARLLQGRRRSLTRLRAFITAGPRRLFADEMMLLLVLHLYWLQLGYRCVHAAAENRVEWLPV